MDFWNQHSIWFLIGLIAWPRILLMYFGFIPAGSLEPILGLIFVPRLFLAGTLTPMYWDTNPILIVICWIFAIIFDIMGIVMKLKSQQAAMDMMKAQAE